MDNNDGRLVNNVVQIDFKKSQGLTKNQAEETLLAQNKRDLFAEWLKEGTVCVLFDARHQGVKVPPEFKDRGELRLNFCHNFRLADFNFNDKAVFATLSFDSGEHFCSVPWNAIYGLQSLVLNQGAVWFLSFPADLDQKAILGFSEDMVDEWPEENKQDTSCCDNEISNVIEFDFSAK